MPVVGRVRALFRYPFKSMGGEPIAAAALDALGVPGDRGWAVRDETAGEMRGAKKLPALLRCSARYRAEPAGDAVPHADVVLPDGTHSATDDPTLPARLSTLLGRRVTVWSRRPPTDREHYRRAAPDDPDMIAELRAIFGRTADEPLPDLSIFPPEILEFTSPLGTYFDAAPLHVLTTATLAALARGDDDARFDVRRFRPNVLVETTPDVAGLVEHGWAGRTLGVGAAAVTVQMPTVRCVMVTLPQPGVPKDPSVLRTIVRDADQNVGCYATVSRAGRVAVGDPVTLE